MDMLRAYKETYVDTESKDTDTCSLWLTSGTTEMPKLVMKSHRSVAEASVIEGNECSHSHKHINYKKKYKRLAKHFPNNWLWMYGHSICVKSNVFSLFLVLSKNHRLGFLGKFKSRSHFYTEVPRGNIHFSLIKIFKWVGQVSSLSDSALLTVNLKTF